MARDFSALKRAFAGLRVTSPALAALALDQERRAAERQRAILAGSLDGRKPFERLADAMLAVGIAAMTAGYPPGYAEAVHAFARHDLAARRAKTPK